MRKSFVLFVIFSLFVGMVFAQPSLQQVAEGLAKNEVTRGNFTLERFSAKTERALKSSGKFTIAAEYGMIWFTEMPVKITQAVTKNFMVTENARGKHTKIEGAENKIFLQMATLTSALFCNDLALAEKNAQIKFSAQNENWQIELFPKDVSVKNMLSKIIVLGEYKNGVCIVTRMQMVFIDKNTTTYQLSNHRFFDTLNDNEKLFFEQ